MRLCGRDAAEVEAFEGPRFEPCESDVVFGPWFSFVLFVLGSWLNRLKLGTIFVEYYSFSVVLVFFWFSYIYMYIYMWEHHALNSWFALCSFGAMSGI